MAPHLFARFRDSMRLFAARPWVSLLLGLALVLSLGSVCCGLGLIAAPWFACELAAMQLAFFLGERVSRSPSWIGAGLVQAVAVVVISAAASVGITWVGLGAPVLDVAPLASDDTGVSAGAVLFPTLAGAVAILYILPFLFAPLILLDRGGGPGAALIDSVRLVGSGGVFRTFAFSLGAHAIQLAPSIAAVVIVLLFADGGLVPVAILGAVPTTAVAVVLGQGMIAAAYAARRDEVPVVRRLSPTLGLSAPATLALACGAIAPALALLLVTGTVAARPARPLPGSAPPGEEIATVTLRGETAQTVRLPGSSLEVRASPQELSVVAGDGGGAGRIPRPGTEPFERLRVVRVRELYALEVSSGDRSWVTQVTRAGVRVDDGLSARLADHVSPVGLLSLLFALVAAPFLLVLALRPFGELRRLSALPDSLRPEGVAMVALRRVAGRRVALSLLLLVPIASLCLHHAVAALR